MFFSSSYPCLTAWAAFLRSLGAGLVAGGLRVVVVVDCARGSGVPAARVVSLAPSPALKRWATFGRPSGTLCLAASAACAFCVPGSDCPSSRESKSPRCRRVWCPSFENREGWAPNSALCSRGPRPVQFNPPISRLSCRAAKERDRRLRAPASRVSGLVERDASAPGLNWTWWTSHRPRLPYWRPFHIRTR